MANLASALQWAETAVLFMQVYILGNSGITNMHDAEELPCRGSLYWTYPPLMEAQTCGETRRPRRAGKRKKKETGMNWRNLKEKVKAGEHISQSQSLWKFCHQGIQFNFLPWGPHWSQWCCTGGPDLEKRKVFRLLWKFYLAFTRCGYCLFFCRILVIRG